jgi:hypothetical protein
MKIKIGIRYNLIYPFLLITFTFFRNVDTLLMDKINEFKGSLLLTLIMFFSEIVSGFTLYIKQILFISNSKKSTSLNSVKINSERTSLNKEISSNSKNIWMYMLLLAISFFDFIQFISRTYYLPNYKKKSNSLEARLQNMTTIFTSLFYHFLLKFNLFKHQKLSLLTLFIKTKFLLNLILTSFK